MGATVDVMNGETPEVLEREVEDIRDNISGIVGELDRRGHELFDWRLQLRKHALLLAAVGAGCILGLGLTITFEVRRRRRYSRPLAKVRRLGEAISRMIAHPERVAVPQPSAGRRALGAMVSATAGTVAKGLARQLLDAAEPTE